MPRKKSPRGPGGAVLSEKTLYGPLTPPLFGSAFNQTMGAAAKSAAADAGLSAIKQGAIKAGVGLVGKGLPVAALTMSGQPSFDAMAKEPYIDEGLSREDYMAKKAGKPMGVQYPTGKRGPSYVKPSYPGQSTVSSLMGVKNPKR
jgi:hypothetical protein